MRRFLISALVAAALPLPQAQPATLRGYGAVPCSVWNDNQDSTTHNIIASWVLGFVSGFELLAVPQMDRGTIGAASSNHIVEAVMASCSTNPTQTIGETSRAAAAYLVQKAAPVNPLASQ